MKCINCNTEFSGEETDTNLKVELSNPGIVLFKGKAISCPQCGEKYTSEENIVELLENFDENYNQKIKE